MSVLSREFNRSLPDGPAKRRRFWRGFAERLDALAAYPTKHAVSEQELRKADDDIRRCRQLMFEKPQHRRDAKFARVTVAREARARNR